MPLTPEYLLSQIDYLQTHKALSESVLRDIVRRLVKTDFTLTETAEWQTEKLLQSGMLYDEILAEIEKRTEKTQEEIKKIFDDSSIEVFDYGEAAALAGYEPQVFRSLSPSMTRTINAAVRKTCTDAVNLTKTCAVTSQSAYIKAADLAHMQIASGAFSYGESIKNAIISAASDGISVLYPSGHVSSLDAAVRSAVLTGVNATYGKITEMRAEELGNDLFELTAHAGARPDHAAWQGKIVSMSGKAGYLSLSDIGYGEVTGFLGAGCRHNWFIFFEGVSERTYTDRELRELSDKTVVYNGRKMTLYDATRYQRSLERKIRKTKSELVALDELQKASEDSEILSKAAAEFESKAVLCRSREAQLEDFCEKTKLDRDRYREQVFAAKTENGFAGYGRRTGAKAMHKVKSRYDDMVKTIGKDYVPSSLDNYLTLSYNNPKEYRYINRMYEGFKNGTFVHNAAGYPVETVKDVRLVAHPNSITQYINKKGGVDRNYYDRDGKQFKQISDNARNEKAAEGYGIHGEHAHDYIYDADGRLERPRRELDETERKENADIL